VSVSLPERMNPARPAAIFFALGPILGSTGLLFLTGLGIDFCTENCAPYHYGATNALLTAADLVALTAAFGLLVFAALDLPSKATAAYLVHLAAATGLLVFWLNVTQHGQVPLLKFYAVVEICALAAVLCARWRPRTRRTPDSPTTT
jgi:hypothetical protein